ncbi:hypothetical protein B0H16DRAFT_1234429, partial [Mycena metata]
SLSQLFPDIESTVINAVLNHQLRARDLYLLDPRTREVEPTYVFDPFTSTFRASTSRSTEYSTLDTVTVPLHNYFAILLVHNAHIRGLPAYLFSYLTQLQTLATQYDWDAVLQYHTLFFNRRLRDMEEDRDFSGWSNHDTPLL